MKKKKERKKERKKEWVNEGKLEISTIQIKKSSDICNETALKKKNGLPKIFKRKVLREREREREREKRETETETERE